MSNPSIILLDVEGTTVPLRFVYDTLFPYARHHLRRYLAHHISDAEVRAALLLLKQENKVDERSGAPPFRDGLADSAEVDGAVQYCLWLMDHDRKTTPLKTIQGKIWQQGFDRGELRSEIFPDVPGCFSDWRNNGIRIAIYSSGSVAAQKLVFGYTPFGNLTPLIDAFFDTRIGPKRDAKSYQKIATALNVPPPTILFISDVISELDAAAGAGMEVALAFRPGNPPISQNAHYPVVHSLTELQLGSGGADSPVLEVRKNST